MVHDYSLWYFELRNYTNEHENGCCFTVIHVCRHPFDSFCKIVYLKDNVPMSLSRVRLTCKKVNSPFRKRNHNNDWVKRSYMCMHFSIINLTVMAFLDRSYIVFKNIIPEIPSMQDILSSEKHDTSLTQAPEWQPFNAFTTSPSIKHCWKIESALR